jgi:hypothetical protein
VGQENNQTTEIYTLVTTNGFEQIKNSQTGKLFDEEGNEMPW